MRDGAHQRGGRAGGRVARCDAVGRWLVSSRNYTLEHHLHSALHFTAGAGKGLGAVTGLHIKLEESDVASASYWESDATGLFTASKI